MGSDEEDAVEDAVDDDVSQGAGTELLHDVLAVGDGGGEADVQSVGYFLVDVSLTEQ